MDRIRIFGVLCRLHYKQVVCFSTRRSFYYLVNSDMKHKKTRYYYKYDGADR